MPTSDEAPPDPPHPMAEAMAWVSRIMTVSLEMVLPGLAGQWLDGRLGTKFLTLAGFALGLTAGTYHLLLMTGSLPKRTGQHEHDNKGEQ